MISQIATFFKVKNNLKKSREELEELQFKKLKKLLIHSYDTIPYYKRLFDKANITPEDITSLDDISKIPITTKKDLQKLAKEEIVSSIYIHKKLVENRTGGSTGIPLLMYADSHTKYLNNALKLRKFFMNGYKLHWNIGVFTQNLTPKKKIHHLLGMHKEVGIPGKESLKKQVEILSKKQVLFLFGMVSRITEVAEYILENNISLSPKKGIISTSENLTTQDIKLIKNAFGVKPSNSYESEEFANIACQCQEQGGLHVDMDAVIVQTRNSQKTGSAVITGLDNFAMPLIRYEIGDIISLSNSSCSCGRNTQMIKKIVGRTNSYVILPSGKKIPGENIETGALSYSDEIQQYQICQNKDLSLTISIVPKKNVKVDQQKIINKISQTYEKIPVKIKLVKNILPLPSGKRQIFVSNIK